MSVSFAPEMDALQYQISCYCGEVVTKQVFPNFQVAYKALNPSSPTIPFEKPVCNDDYCKPDFPRIRAVDEDRLTVNLSGTNAVRILRMLGLFHEGDDSGSVSGSEFLSRVQASLAGLPVVEGPRPSFSLGGSYAGYAQDRLAELEIVAAFAAARDAQVVWG